MSGLENRKSRGKEERPWFIEFFFDRSRPLALRAGVGLVIACVASYPVIAVQFQKDEKPQQQQQSQSTGPGQPAANGVPAPGTENEPGPRPGAPALPGELKIVSTGPAIDPVFRKTADVNPIFVGSFVSPEGDVWVASSQQVYQFREGLSDAEHFSVRLDPRSYDQVDEMPQITALMRAPDGSVWAGAKDGSLHRYAEFDWKAITSAGEPFKSPLRAMIGFDEKLYIGGQGLWKWDSKTGKIVRFPAFNGKSIHSFTVRKRPDGAAELMMAAENGIWKMTDQGWALILATNGPDQQFRTLLDLGSEGFLAGTNDGMLRVSPQGLVLERAIPGNFVTAIARDSKGHLWVGTRGAGLKYWNGASWFQFSPDEGFPGPNVSLLEIDKGNRLWIGAFGRGLFSAPLEQLEQVISQHQDTSRLAASGAPKVYSSVCKAAAEYVKDGTSGAVSLFRFDGKEYVFFSGRQVCPLGAGYLSPDRTAYLLSGWNLTVASQAGRAEIEIPKEYPADQVKKVLFVDSKRNVWFGPTSGGPFVMTPSGQPPEKPTFHDFSSIPQLQKNPTSFVVEDKNGAIWVGSAPPFDRDNEQFRYPSLHLYLADKWSHFTPKHGLSSWMLKDAVLRKDGTIAIAGDNGLSFVRGGAPERVHSSDALKKRYMFSIFEDRVGDLWIGHQYFGLGVTFFDSTEFHNVTTEQGLFADRIIAVSQDSQDRMWLLASNGTVGIYPRSFFDRKVAEGERLPAPIDGEAPPQRENGPDESKNEMIAPPADESVMED